MHVRNGRDRTLIERFYQFNDAHALPEFVELYIQRDLRIGLSRREPALPRAVPRSEEALR